MKKIIIFSLIMLTVTNIAQLSAFTFKVINALDTKKCINIDASGQTISKAIEPGKQADFTFSGWKSGLCIKSESITIQEFKENCPKTAQKEIANIITTDSTLFKNLKNAALETYKNKDAKKENNLKNLVDQAITSIVAVAKLCETTEFILIQKDGKSYAVMAEKK